MQNTFKNIIFIECLVTTFIEIQITSTLTFCWAITFTNLFTHMLWFNFRNCSAFGTRFYHKKIKLGSGCEERRPLIKPLHVLLYTSCCVFSFWITALLYRTSPQRQSRDFLQPPVGATRIWKWQISVYRRTKTGAFGVWFRRKKGVIGCGFQ